MAGNVRLCHWCDFGRQPTWGNEFLGHILRGDGLPDRRDDPAGELSGFRVGGKTSVAFVDHSVGRFRRLLVAASFLFLQRAAGVLRCIGASFGGVVVAQAVEVVVVEVEQVEV